MVNILLLMGITIAMSIVGGGVAYGVWLLTRPRKQVWRARVYRLGDGLIPKFEDRGGKILSEIQLSDLIPHGIDFLEKTSPDYGMEVYRLQKMDKTTPAVTSDCVETWGGKLKEVTVLLDGNNCTLIKKGYDRDGRMVFRPIPYETMNMIQHETAIKKHRMQKEKDLIVALTPWVVIGMSLLFLFGMSYILVEGFISISDRQASASNFQATKQTETAKIFQEGIVALANATERMGQKQLESAVEAGKVYREAIQQIEAQKSEYINSS